MEKFEYVANIMLHTQNDKIGKIAEAMFDQNVSYTNANEMLAYWDNLDERSGEWWPDHTSYTYDGHIVIDIHNAGDRVNEFMSDIYPDIMCDRMQQIKKHSDEYKNGLITTNELVAFIDKLTEV